MESRWHYAIPELTKEVATIGIGVDGANIFLSQEGYRETMVGTISFYDAKGERLHTIYQAAAPEYGKATFWERMTAKSMKSKNNIQKQIMLVLQMVRKTIGRF